MTVMVGKYTVLVNACDNESGIKKVEFWVDSQLRHTDNESPYNWTWSDKGIYPHTLLVVAYDNAGNHAEDTMALWKFRIFGGQ